MLQTRGVSPSDLGVEALTPQSDGVRGWSLGR